MPLDRPCLRPFLRRAADPRDEDHVYLLCGLGLASKPVRVRRDEFACLEFFDGDNTLADVRQAVLREKGLLPPPPERLHVLVTRLEQSLLLDGPRFRGAVENPVRPPRCIGCYASDPADLREQMSDLFGRGAGWPRAFGVKDDLRAILAPHIDYHRGGATYTWAFKELAERSLASLFVIIGTSHHSPERFTLTRKDFQTPLGIARTDQDYLDRLVRHYGQGLFDDEWRAHLPEHSIELEVVFLQHVFEGKRDFRIVPLVVGSFHDCIHLDLPPWQQPEIARMIDALQAVERETKERICYVISGDLAHIGPKFNDGETLTDDLLARSDRQDRWTLDCLEKLDGERYFRQVAAERDQRNICGLPPTLVALGAAQPACGTALAYERYVHPRGLESVSYASAAFYS